jgi:hypothetical protein
MFRLRMVRAAHPAQRTKRGWMGEEGVEEYRVLNTQYRVLSTQYPVRRLEPSLLPACSAALRSLSL